MSQRQAEVTTTASVQTVPSAPPADTGVPGTVPVEPGLASPENSTSAAGQNVFERRRASAPPSGGVEQRKSAVDRRAGIDRRVVDVGAPTGLERRRGPGRRRSDDRRSAEEGEMTDEQFEFVLAIDTYKRLNNRPFPTWTEVLEVTKQLGYRKVAQSTLALPNSRPGSASTAAASPEPFVPATTTHSVPPSEYLPG